MKKIDAILMASGFSERFEGENKLLFLYKDKPIARYTIELAGSMGFNKVILVAADSKIAHLADGLDITTIKNDHPEYGQRESIRLGVSKSDADFYMFFPCDQPLLDAGTVALIAERAEEGKIVYPAYNGIPGNPALFSKLYRRELMELGQGENARVIKQRHKKSCIKVEIESESALFDVDTRSDLRRLSYFQDCLS